MAESQWTRREFLGERLHVLQDDLVRFNGQPIALVVAETLDDAEYAASLLRVDYAHETARLDFDTALEHAVAPEAGLIPDSRVPADSRRGEPDRALAEAAVRLDRIYRIPRQQHNPMEPHATIALWQGDRLTLWDKSQWVITVRDELAAVFGLTPDQVHVIAPFVGGAFGTTLRAWPHVVLAALAARQLGRPVKLVLARRQMYAGTGYRPETWQRVAVGGRTRRPSRRARSRGHGGNVFVRAVHRTAPRGASISLFVSSRADAVSARAAGRAHADLHAGARDRQRHVRAGMRAR